MPEVGEEGDEGGLTLGLEYPGLLKACLEYPGKFITMPEFSGLA